MSEPSIQVRTYPGRTEAEASARLAEDEAPMAAAGYRPSSQSWAETIKYGTVSKVLFAIAALSTAGGWLVFWPLSIVAIAFLVVGMVKRTRTGELTVTWTGAGPVHRVATSGPAMASPGVAPDAE